MSSQRERCFWIRTYLTEEQLLQVLEKNLSIIYRYAYAIHDKDKHKTEDRLVEPHIHLLLRFVDKYTITKVRKMFKGYFDSNDKEVNTQVLFREKTDTHCIQYLVHKNDKSKFQYNADIIRAFNYDIDEELAKELPDTIQNDVSLVFDILFREGWTSSVLKKLISQFGRDFAYHYKNIKELYFDVKTAERVEREFLHSNIIDDNGVVVASEINDEKLINKLDEVM